MGTIAAVVLAAGEASRFGSAKQQLLLPRVLERLAKTSIDEVVVVEGAYELKLPRDTMSQGVSAVRCPDWALGPGASLRCGLAALGDDVESAVVVLADGPTLAPAAVERVLDRWRRDGGVVAASYEGSRGHPLVLDRSEWGRVPDEGGRALSATLVPCDDLGAPGDIDRPEDMIGL